MRRVSPLSRGYGIALLSALILSTTAIFIRYLSQEYLLPALVLAFWRDLFVALGLLLFFSLFRPLFLKVSPSHLPYLAGYGLVLAVFNAAWTLSVSLNGAAIATVLAYSSGGFTVLLGWWLLKERLGGLKLTAAFFSLLGCALVAEALNPQVWQTNLTGILTGVGSGFLYAVYSILGRSASRRGLNPWATLLFTFGFAALFLLLMNLQPFALPGKGDLLTLGDSLPGWGILLALALLPTLLGFGLYNVSLAYLPSSVANLIVSLEPAFTALIAYFFLAERFRGGQALGSGFILLAVLLLRFSGEES